MRLARNIYLNLSAFTINALIGLSVIPLVITAYGVEGYGLIVLARQLLPVGIIGLFEGGLPEVTSRYVASATAEGNHRLAGKYLIASTFVAALIAIGLSAGLFASIGGLVDTLGIPPAQAEAFGLIIAVTAASLPMHFAGGVWRGALEGLDRFGWVRFVEVGGTILYAALVVLLPMKGASLETLAIGYVLIGNVRTIAYFFMLRALRSVQIDFCFELDFRSSRPMLSHAASFFPGKLYSAMFNHVPTVLVGLTSGVAIVGAYDAIMRVPRLLKTVTGMFGNALLPHSARMESLGEQKAARELIEVGSLLLAAVVLPAGMAMMVFSEEIIYLLLGQNQSNLAPWFALALIWPLLLSVVGIGNSMVVARHHAVKQMNQISLINLIAYCCVSAFVMQLLGWQAFIVALIVSSIISIPLQLVLVRREYGIDNGALFVFLVRAMLIGAIAFALKVVFEKEILLDSYGTQLTAFFITMLLLYLSIYQYALAGRERSIIRKKFVSLIAAARN